ncbi:MAG: hypothetical protein HFI90_00795 [Clostridia bacterium]|nr:hypothetical protein [Clostridia bacterium]
MDSKKNKQLIAPITITCISVLFLLSYIVAILLVDLPLGFSLLLLLIPLALAGVCIFVLIERIKEIRSGEEDDLSQY